MVQPNPSSEIQITSTALILMPPQPKYFRRLVAKLPALRYFKNDYDPSRPDAIASAE